MYKKVCLTILAFALVLGTIVAALPPAKAAPSVRFYIYPEPVPAKASGLAVDFEVRIETDLPDDSPDSIVGWSLSLRVDPRALEPFGAGKIAGMGGFLEAFLVRWGYDWDYTTAFYVGAKDTETGTFFDISEFIQGYGTLGLGAGGSGRLARIRFYSRSDVIPSVIDMFGVPPVIEAHARWLGVDGVWHMVDVEDDGYYIAQTPDAMYFDAMGTYDPANPIGSDWHELWPTFCQEWSLESWTDNGSPGFDASDQIDMVQIQGGAPGTVIWGHADYVNPTPVPNDGKADLIITTKPPPVPEFPLGIGVLMAIVPLIPIVYIWRLRKKSR